MAVNTLLNLALNVVSTKAAIAGNVPTDAVNLVKKIEYGNGVGAGNADKFYYAERSIPLSSSETLDISGALTDNLGQTFTIARIKALVILCEPFDATAVRNTNDVIVGAAAGTQWAALLGTTGTLTLKPGSLTVFAAGTADAVAWPAANGATDSLKIANGGAGTPVVYQIYMVGVSA